MLDCKITFFLKLCAVCVLSATGWQPALSQQIRIGNQQLNRVFFGEDRIVVRSTNRSQPVSSLPESVDYPRGVISIVVDQQQSGTESQKTVVYLINSSEEPLKIDPISYELPVVLEANLGGNHWERAEVVNPTGIVRSSTKNDRLYPGTFRIKQTQSAKSGEDVLLRYSFYQNGTPIIISEPFQGKLPVGEIDKARFDMMSASAVPPPLRIRYIETETKQNEVTGEWFDKLKLLRILGPCYVDLGHAQRWAADIHENPVSTREERDAAVALQLELLQPWPSQYDLFALHRHCQETLLNENETGSIRAICWNVIGDFAEKNPRPEHLDYGTLAETAWNLLFDDFVPDSEKESAVDFLCVKSIAENHSPAQTAEDFEKMLSGVTEHVRIVAANRIMSRGQQKPVFDFYTDHIDQISVSELIKILHFDRLHNPFARPNWALWEKALNKNIEFTIPKLAMMFESDPTETKLRKFPESSALPPEIKSRLSSYCNSAPNTETRQSARRLLDNVKKRGVGFFGRLPQF